MLTTLPRTTPPPRLFLKPQRQPRPRGSHHFVVLCEPHLRLTFEVLAPEYMLAISTLAGEGTIFFSRMRGRQAKISWKNRTPSRA